MAPKSTSKTGASSRGKDSANEDGTTNDLKTMIAELSQEGLLKMKSLLDKQLKQTVARHKNGSSSSKSAGRSSQKSINASNTLGDDEEHEISNEKDVDEELEEGDELSDEEDEYVTFGRLSKKRKVTVVRGGDIHMDEYGQGWRTTLGHAVKNHVRDIDLNWKQISKDVKMKIVTQMEEKFSTGVTGDKIIYLAGRSFNHWNKTQTAPLYIEPDVWDRFLESRKADFTHQKNAAAARKERQRWGRRGIAGMRADYFRDWGCYPSPTTIKRIKDMRTYKLYRESLIAEGEIPGNYKSQDYIGKKGEKKNKQLKKQRKEKVKNIARHEDPAAIPTGNLGDVDQANHEEEQNVQNINLEEQNFEAAHDMDMDWEGNEMEVEDQQLAGADGTPDWAHEMMERTATPLPVKKTVMGPLKKKKRVATEKNENGSISKKKVKKGRGIGRNLSPDFIKETVTRNISQYKSIQRGK